MFGLFRKDKRVLKLKYQPCPLCASKDWIVRGSPTLVEIFDTPYLRQNHQCGGCGTRFNLIRTHRDPVWHFTRSAAAINAR